MYLDPLLWLNANRYLYPKRRAYGGKILLFSLLALAIALWLTFPVTRLPDSKPGAGRFTLNDLVTHGTLPARVIVGPVQLPCCGARDLGLWIESPPAAAQPNGSSPSNSAIPLGHTERFSSMLYVESKTATSAIVAVKLNNELVEFQLDGRAGLLHQLTLEPGTSYRIPFEVNIPRPGTYRVEVTAHYAPDELLLAFLHRLVGNFQVAGSYRTILVEAVPSASSPTI